MLYRTYILNKSELTVSYSGLPFYLVVYLA